MAELGVLTQKIQDSRLRRVPFTIVHEHSRYSGGEGAEAITRESVPRNASPFSCGPRLPWFNSTLCALCVYQGSRSEHLVWGNKIVAGLTATSLLEENVPLPGYRFEAALGNATGSSLLLFRLRKPIA